MSASGVLLQDNPAGRQLYLAEQFAYTTVRIKCLLADGQPSLGTAFFFEFPRAAGHLPVLITNWHVVEDSVDLQFRLRSRNDAGWPDNRRNTDFNLPVSSSSWIRHPDPAVDLAAYVVGREISAMIGQGKPPFFRACNPTSILKASDIDAINAVEEVLMVGYPEGMWDSFNNLPLTRAGITATHPAADYEGQKEFLIDIACFFGSSGSPVFLNPPIVTVDREGNSAPTDPARPMFLGVLYAGMTATVEGDVTVKTIPTHKKLITLSERFLNLGVVIKAERILEFDRLLPHFGESQ